MSTVTCTECMSRTQKQEASKRKREETKKQNADNPTKASSTKVAKLKKSLPKMFESVNEIFKAYPDDDVVRNECIEFTETARKRVDSLPTNVASSVTAVTTWKAAEAKLRNIESCVGELLQQLQDVKTASDILEDSDRAKYHVSLEAINAMLDEISRLFD